MNITVFKNLTFILMFLSVTVVGIRPLKSEEITLLCISDNGDKKFLVTVDTYRKIWTRWWRKWNNGEIDTKQKIRKDIQILQGMFYWNKVVNDKFFSDHQEGWINRTTGEYRYKKRFMFYGNKYKNVPPSVFNTDVTFDCHSSTKPKTKF